MIINCLIAWNKFPERSSPIAYKNCFKRSCFSNNISALKILPNHMKCVFDFI